MNTKNLYTLILTVFFSFLVPLSASAEEKKEPVTIDNLVRAETDHMIRENIKSFGMEVGKIVHQRDMVDLDNQPVFRMQQDTLYSGVIVDLSKPAEVTLPEIGGRYQSMHVVNQDHYMYVEAIYDTGDDIEKCLEILELIKKNISDKPIHTAIYSHAHYGFGTKAITDAYGEDIKIIGHPELNKNLLESGALGSAIPELAPSLLARTLEQFSILLPPEGPAPTPVGKTKGFVPVNTPVEHGQEMTVDGVEMVFYTDFDSDTDDQVMVYLPKSKTVLNNHLWPAYPNF